MADDFNKGDKVEWNSPQGKVEGGWRPPDSS